MNDAATTSEQDASRLPVPPWMQLVGLPLLILFGYVFVRAASHAVVVFIIAALISLLLAPVVRRLVALGVPRLVSVLAVFGTFAAIVATATIIAVDLISNQAVELSTRVDDIGNVAVTQLDTIQGVLDDRGISIDLRDQGVQFVRQLEDRSTELSGEALNLGTELVRTLAEAAFNVVLIIVVSIYMLLDAPRISRMVASLAPPQSGIERLFGRLERSLLRYTIGQTAASVVMGASASIGLWVMGHTGIWEQGDDYAVLFGLIVAITEFAPSIGPVIGSIPPFATAVFDGPGPALAVLVFFLLLHQIEGHVVIPKLMGSAIAVHPLFVIFGILAGAQIMGIGGVLLALPLLAVGREIVLFLRERLMLGRWPEPAPVGVATTPETAEMPPRRTLRERVRELVSRGEPAAPRSDDPSHPGR